PRRFDLPDCDRTRGKVCAQGGARDEKCHTGSRHSVYRYIKQPRESEKELGINVSNRSQMNSSLHVSSLGDAVCICLDQFSNHFGLAGEREFVSQKAAKSCQEQANSSPAIPARPDPDMKSEKLFDVVAFLPTSFTPLTIALVGSFMALRGP